MVWRVMIVILLVAVAVGVVVERAVTNTQIRTISGVCSSDVEGGAVAIKGVVVFADANRFVLDDGTGRAELSTCPVWYKHISLQEGDEVTAVGQILSNPSLTMNCDFVLSVYKILRGREVIQVRRRPGKPPWTSYSTSEVPELP